MSAGRGMQGGAYLHLPQGGAHLNLPSLGKIED